MTVFINEAITAIDHLPAKERAIAYSLALFCFALFTVLMVVAVRRRYPEAFKNVSPGILSPIGALFALTASFLIADVWNKNANSLDVVANETQAVHQILNISSRLPEPLPDFIRSRMDDYRRLVLEEEAPALSQMKTIENDINARARRILYDISAATAAQTDPASAKIFAITNDLFKYRNQRMAIAVDVTQSRRVQLSTILGFFLIAVVAATHSEGLLLLATMTFMTAAATAIVVSFAIYNGRPFDYDVSMLNEGGFFSNEKDNDLISGAPLKAAPARPVAEKEKSKKP